MGTYYLEMTGEGEASGFPRLVINADDMVEVTAGCPHNGCWCDGG